MISLAAALVTAITTPPHHLLFLLPDDHSPTTDVQNISDLGCVFGQVTVFPRHHHRTLPDCHLLRQVVKYLRVGPGFDKDVLNAGEQGVVIISFLEIP
jgi:hypothetical protein